MTLRPSPYLPWPMTPPPISSRLPRRLVTAFLLQNRARSPKGLTLIECLVAILMVALLATAIAPALALAVATRVQSQKSEQALQLAQTEIDRVRRLTERGQANDTLPAYLAQLPPRVAGLDNTNQAARGQPAPGSQVEIDRVNLTSANKTLGVKINPAETGTTLATDCRTDASCDFAVQIYRSKGYPDSATDVPSAFVMGVRVYDYRAVTSGATLSTDPAALALSAGDGGRSQKPLAVLYTTIAAGEREKSLCDLIRYTSGNANAALPADCSK